jgi:hypothetical protein
MLRSFLKLFWGKGSRRRKVPGALPACSLLCSVLMLLASCSTKRVGIPTYEGVDLRDELSKKESIHSLDSTFSIEFIKEGNIMKGDAVLRLTRDSLDLQVYSLGFLIAEVSANSTSTRSNPSIDRNRLFMLVDGLRNSFFWWSIKNPEIRDDHDSFRVSNSWRRLFVNRKTIMPEKQFIELDDGRELKVIYEEPAPMDGIWFPSKMRIELSNQSISLGIKTLTVHSD